jgi:hypothetical protein
LQKEDQSHQTHQVFLTIPPEVERGIRALLLAAQLYLDKKEGNDQAGVD